MESDTPVNHKKEPVMQTPDNLVIACEIPYKEVVHSVDAVTIVMILTACLILFRVVHNELKGA